jgi:signal transduction histidine kinase
MLSVSGLLAILNEQRQVIAINDSFLHDLGILEPDKTLGLRLGEIIDCAHCNKPPAGCGTTKYCSTCGAAIAMVASLTHNESIERMCALEKRKGEAVEDIALKITASPITISDQRFLLLLLQDITSQHQKAALERTFFHDMNNILAGLIGASELMTAGQTGEELIATIRQGALRLQKEIEIQKSLSENGLSHYSLSPEPVTISSILCELQSFFTNHPARDMKQLFISSTNTDQTIITDASALLRILSNMVTNALEATTRDNPVHVWSECNKIHTLFHVHNNQEIPKNVQLRIFKRYFSTKAGEGRGLGTYAMKLLGERVLGGEVRFKSSKKIGTVFTLALPN